MTAKSFVELFGGSMTVESNQKESSESPRGTVVTVCLARAH
jgi:signal transduction histidine kinase